MHSRIEEIRHNTGLTKKDFATKLDITEQAYSNYSKGKRIIPTDVLLKTKQLFNISIDWIITGEEEIKSNMNYKSEIIDTLEELNNTQLKYIYHITEAEKLKS
jgi:transcriptional regulator with XRE-family HTH domain